MKSQPANSPARHSLEPLEARLAPAGVSSLTLVNARTATFTDLDGETVTVRTSQGTFEAGDFVFDAQPDGRSQLLQLNLSDDGAEFAGANLSFYVTKRVRGGDGQVHVGYLNATGLDLGEVRIRGDLGQIDAGDADTTTAALSVLRVNSLGRFGTATQAAPGASLESNINGALDRLVVVGDVAGAYVNVGGGVDARVGEIVVRGSLIGGADFNSGTIFADGGMGDVYIAGDVEGGTGSGSGNLFSFGGIGRVVIGGSLLGGAGPTSGFISTFGDIAALKIGGDVRGGSGIGSGAVTTTASIGTFAIGGSLLGGSGDDSGEIFASGDISRISIRRDFIGGSISGADGSLTASGYIESLGRIGSIFIGGSFFTGVDTSAAGTLASCGAIRAGDDLGTLTVFGSVVGNADSVAIIVARGRDNPTATTDLAIGRIYVGGRIESALICAGYDRALTGVNADAQIGSVHVGGDWVASSLVAGTSAGADTLFGTADDALLTGPGVKDDARALARIGSVSIRGTALGTPESVNAVDHCGLVAERIGPVRARFTGLPHPVGAHNSNAPIGLTGDFTLLEV